MPRLAVNVTPDVPGGLPPAPALRNAELPCATSAGSSPTLLPYLLTGVVQVQRPLPEALDVVGAKLLPTTEEV